MVKKTTNTTKTKVPMTKIKELVKRKKSLDTYVHQLMEDYGVSIGYIRGLLKEPLNESKSKK